MSAAAAIGPAPVSRRYPSTTTLHPGRLGYRGPGRPMHTLAGNPSTRRGRWGQALASVPTHTATAVKVGVYLASFGDPDGSRVFPSQARVAAELALADATVCRALCELEDTGYLVVVRWRPTEGPGGRWHRRHTNVYSLALPLADAHLVGRRRLRHRAIVEARKEVREAEAAVEVARRAEELRRRKALEVALAVAEAHGGPPPPPPPPRAAIPPSVLSRSFPKPPPPQPLSLLEQPLSAAEREARDRVDSLRQALSEHPPPPD